MSFTILEILQIFETSIMSPRNLLYFSVCKFKEIKPSLYGNLHKV